MIIRYKGYKIDGSSLRVSGAGIPFELVLITPPKKSTYLVGESPSTDGMVLRATIDKSSAYFNVPNAEVTAYPEVLTETDTLVTYVWRGMKVSFPVSVRVTIPHPRLTNVVATTYKYNPGGNCYNMVISKDNLICCTAGSKAVIFKGTTIIKEYTLPYISMSLCYMEDTNQFWLTTQTNMYTMWINGTTGAIDEEYTPSTRMTPYAGGVAYSDGHWVLAPTNTNTNPFYSDDGKTWKRITEISQLAAFAVCYAKGTWVIMPSSGVKDIFYSHDGVHFEKGNNPLTNSNFLCCVYNDGQFVSVQNSSNRVMLSNDGIDWTYVTQPQSGYWRGLCVAKGNLFSMCYNGSAPSGRAAIFSSDNVNWSIKVPVSGVVNQNWVAFCYNPEIDMILASSADSPAVLQYMQPTWVDPEE